MGTCSGADLSRKIVDGCDYTGRVVAEANLFCPLHGDYIAGGDSTRCPACAEDPVASSASLRQVRVVREQDLAPANANDDQLTPVADEFPCPVCGQVTIAGNFRTESVGEVWTGNAAVWAEEGVCSDCYRDVLSPQIRAWSDAEWLVHHYEGWRATVDTVHNIFVHEESVQEGWLPEDDRHRVLDVEKTLSSRREHLARCQLTMRDLQARYRADMTPPPFQMTLASASEAVSPKAVAELHARRERDIQTEMRRRHDSVVAQSPIMDTGDFPARIDSRESMQAIPSPRREGWVLPVALLAVAAVIVAAVLWWVGDRVI